jgi:aldose sugar dehydrogenase
MNKYFSGNSAVGSFLIALVVGLFLGTLVQTQVNLLALRQLGANLSLQNNLATVLHDMWGFLPLYLLIFGCAFAVSQLVALLFTHLTGASLRMLWCTLGAATGLWATFKLVDMMVPMPILVAATRSVFGMACMLITAALAGALFARLVTRQNRSRLVAPAMAVMLAVTLLAPSGQALAQKVSPSAKGYVIETFMDGLENPWSIAFLPGGGALITEKPGRLRVVTPEGKLVPEPVRGMPAVLHAGQAGLFEVLPATDFEKSRRLFLSYACGTPNSNHTCVASANLQNNRLENLKEIFRADFAKKGTAHYGGRMVLLPDDTLVIGLGDGFIYREEAQNLSNHLGKIVRINTDGSVPKNNPFVSRPGAKPEIYSYGHRNIQGLVYDSDNKRLIAHEHGPKGGDEVNIIRPGVNYGWPLATYGLDYTGAKVSPFTEYEGTQQPEVYWVPSIAPSGMALYSGNMFPDWKGSLLVGALKARWVSRVAASAGKTADREGLFKELGERIRDVRTGPDGAVYLLTDNPDGKVLRVYRP